MSKVIAPPALQPGDTIGVMAPSSYVEREDIEKSAALLESKGYKVFVHPQTFERDNQFAGSDLNRALALQGLWHRKDIKAIWCAGGGNGALQLLDTINFKKMGDAPKILLGFSDVTALLNAIYAHTGAITFHGPVFKNVHKYDQLDQLLNLVAGKKAEWDFSQSEMLAEGIATGSIIGGNLRVFHYLPQTLPGKFWKKSILFLEDCNEELSHVDSMLLHLKRLGVLDEISGLIFGEFTNLKDTGRPYGLTLEDIVKKHTSGLKIPILMNAPFGHGKNLQALPIGATGILNAHDRTLTLKNQAVTL